MVLVAKEITGIFSEVHSEKHNCPDRISLKRRIENWVVGVSISVTNNCSDSDKLLHRVLLCFFFFWGEKWG